MKILGITVATLWLLFGGDVKSRYIVLTKGK